MFMVDNLILDSSGFKPVTNDNLNSVGGISWHNWLNVNFWKRNNKKYTTQEALEIVRKENIK